ncbi:hypothetical protein VTO42DRAFT_1999 [Malbranchea cinnamomea]
MPEWTKCEDIDFNDPDIPWLYCGSFPAATLFASLFFVLTTIHFIQMFVFRKKFCWVIVMAGLWSIAGFALRALSTRMMRDMGPFIPMQLLIILAPLWLNAFVYMVLGRMIHFFIPDQRCFGIKARRLTVIFLLLDIFSFLVQGVAGSLMSSEDSPDLVKIGIKIYMAGVGIQELFIVIFSGLAMRFHYKMNQIDAVQPSLLPWRSLLYTVYAGLFLITLRIIYRLIEYSQGTESAIAKAEAAFYILDATPMVIAMLLFNIFHPGRALVGPDSEFPKKEKKKKKKKKLIEDSGDDPLDVEDTTEMDDVAINDANGEENANANGDHGGSVNREATHTSRRSRRSRRSGRSEGGVLVIDSRAGIESGTHAEIDHIPLQHHLQFHGRPANYTLLEQSRAPYPH